jgi:hypothetical protein
MKIGCLLRGRRKEGLIREFKKTICGQASNGGC